MVGGVEGFWKLRSCSGPRNEQVGVQGPSTAMLVPTSTSGPVAYPSYSTRSQRAGASLPKSLRLPRNEAKCVILDYRLDAAR